MAKLHCCNTERGCEAPDCDFDEACGCTCGCERCDNAPEAPATPPEPAAPRRCGCQHACLGCPDCLPARAPEPAVLRTCATCGAGPTVTCECDEPTTGAPEPAAPACERCGKDRGACAVSWCGTLDGVTDTNLAPALDEAERAWAELKTAEDAHAERVAQVRAEDERIVLGNPDEAERVAREWLYAKAVIGVVRARETEDALVDRLATLLRAAEARGRDAGLDEAARECLEGAEHYARCAASDYAVTTDAPVSTGFKAAYTRIRALLSK